MTTPAASDCDLCNSEPAVMSQMDLTNWSTIRVGQNCLVTFLVSALQALTGMEPDLTPAGEVTADSAPAAPETPQEAAPGPDADQDPPAQQPPSKTPRAARPKAAGK